MGSSQTLDPWLGRSIGDRQRYLITKRIGGGGMGDVYLATDTLLGQPVALKLLTNRLANAELGKRLEQEVAVCAALRSDHIVQVTDYGMAFEGYPFFVMEYLQGQTLGQLMRREKCISVERAVNIVTQVCLGLNPAHQGIYLQSSDSANSSEYVKVVHRDLKPDNIFLVPTALGEFVKILDFGIAKIRGDQANFTNATSMFLGTYQYASPEQLKNEKTLDGRADIYSLGVILYEMVSGAKPFQRRDNPADEELTGVGWAVAHLTKAPLPLRQQPGCEELPEELEAIVMRCLEKAPEQRFSSVIELSQALQDVVSHSGHFKLTLPGNSEKKRIEMQPSNSAVTLKDSRFPEASGAIASSQERYSSNFPTLIFRSLPLSKYTVFLRKPSLLLAGAGTLAVLVAALVTYWQEPPALLSSYQKNSVLQEPKASPEVTVEPAVTQSTQSVEPFIANSLVGHQDAVWTVAISPNGFTLASGSYDRTIRLWDISHFSTQRVFAEKMLSNRDRSSPTQSTEEIVRVLSAHSDSVRSIAFSANGKILASGSSDKTIKIWNAQTGELLRTLYGHVGPVWSIAISSDGKTLASGSYDGTVKIWDLQTGRSLHTLPDHYDSIWSVAISPDGKTLASASYDGTIRIWDLPTGKPLRTLSGHSDVVRSIAISPDSKTLASASWDKTIKIWNLTTGDLLQTLSGHTDRVLSVAFSPTGKTLASGSIDRTIKIWDLQAGKLLHTLTGHSSWVISVAFSPNGKTLVSGSRDKTVKLWQL